LRTVTESDSEARISEQFSDWAEGCIRGDVFFDSGCEVFFDSGCDAVEDVIGNEGGDPAIEDPA
jgi:hypothetical protein